MIPPRMKAVVAMLVIVIATAGIYIFLSQRDSEKAARESSRAARAATTAVDSLAKVGERSDCIRQVIADADEAFRHDIRDLILAGRDTDKVRVIVERMRSRPNYADTVLAKCGPAPK